MKLKNLLFYFAIGVSTLVFGLAWVGVYNFFLSISTEKDLTIFSCKVKEIKETKQIEEIKFDINDPNSVLPIDYKEEELSDPKADENNPEYFDPRGFYYNDNLPAEFDEFAFIKIYGQYFEIPAYDKKPSDFDSLNVNLLIDDKAKDEEDRLETVSIENFEIGNDSLNFKVQTKGRIVYEFRGEFLVKGNFYTLDENAKVLKGKLLKIKNNEVLAETEIEFNWTYGIGCCLR